MNSVMIDLRSDTVTHPTDSMRKAMSTAEVGDDVYSEDPTINLLEERAAELMEREAAVFVPTGTMGNQIAIHLHTSPGSEVVAEAERFDGMIGSSSAMRRLYRILEKVAGSDASVLVAGETGTGKELVAREIHRRSRFAGGTW